MEAEQRKIAYQEVFATPNGKAVLEDLDRQCMYQRNAYNPASDRQTCYNLGCQWVVQYIHNILAKKEDLAEEVINEGTKL